MVMGESGIFSKANLAKEQTQKSTAEEIIKLAVLENEADKVAENNYLENEKLKEEITKKLEEQGYKVEENKVIYYEDKTINIEDYLTKEEAKEDTLKTENITAQDVQKHPDWYYGKKVTNYESQNGQNDWRIFYSDGTQIFLITGDYINTTETNRINTTATGMTTSSYSAYWASNSVPAFQTVDSTTLTRFKATEYTLQSEINNSKCVSTLLNENNWSSYKDSGSKAEKAIGSPTVEMWMDSWNARYPNSSDQVYRKASTSTSYPGYYVGTSSDPTGSYYIDSSVMRVKEGYNNKLYYPHTSIYNNGTNGYWLASPSAYSSSYVLRVSYGGNVSNSACDNSHLGVRPVVSLNSGITVNAEDVE